jgi:hypothetical protein
VPQCRERRGVGKGTIYLELMKRHLGEKPGERGRGLGQSWGGLVQPGRTGQVWKDGRPGERRKSTGREPGKPGVQVHLPHIPRVSMSSLLLRSGGLGTSIRIGPLYFLRNWAPAHPAGQDQQGSQSRCWADSVICTRRV